MSKEELKKKLLERTQKMLEAVVDDVMTKDVLSCDYHDTAAKASRILLENGFLGLMIIRDGKPFNMVTCFDLLRLGYEEVFDLDRDFLRISVGEIVAEKEFIHLPPGTLLRDVLNVMVQKAVRTIPIISKEKVYGLCSMTDLIHWYRNNHPEVRTGKL